MSLGQYICYSQHNHAEYLVLTSLNYSAATQEVILTAHPIKPKTELIGDILNHTMPMLLSAIPGNVISTIDKADAINYVKFIEKQKNNYMLPSDSSELTLRAAIRKLHEKSD